MFKDQKFKECEKKNNYSKKKEVEKQLIISKSVNINNNNANKIRG